MQELSKKVIVKVPSARTFKATIRYLLRHKSTDATKNGVHLRQGVVVYHGRRILPCDMRIRSFGILNTWVLRVKTTRSRQRGLAGRQVFEAASCRQRGLPSGQVFEAADLFPGASSNGHIIREHCLIERPNELA